MTMSDTAPTDTQLAKSTYTPAELAYLLAGRDNPEAQRAREMLGLAELHEGSPGIREAVQSLQARGLVSLTADGDADIEQSTKVLGFVLGTATDWTRLAVQARGGVEALAILSAPGVASALILRLDEIGNFQAVATNPGVHGSQITGTMVSGYLTQGPEVAVSVRRDVSDEHTVLVVKANTDADEYTITHRAGIAGEADVPEGTELVVDKATYLANLEALLGA